jgi:hypothetical protein
MNGTNRAAQKKWKISVEVLYETEGEDATLESNIKTYLRQMSGVSVNYINSAQEGIQWWALVNTVINVRVVWNSRISRSI